MVVLPPAMPFTHHFTAVLLALETIAMNCCVDPTCTWAEEGEIETEIADGAGGAEEVGCEELLIEPPPHPARDKAVPKHISGASSLPPTMAHPLGSTVGEPELWRLDGTCGDAVARQVKVKVGPGVRG